MGCAKKPLWALVRHLDVLDAEQELLDARASLVSAQIDEVRAGYMLLATMGLLTAERLNLNVPRYDLARLL